MYFIVSFVNRAQNMHMHIILVDLSSYLFPNVFHLSYKIMFYKNIFCNKI